MRTPSWSSGTTSTSARPTASTPYARAPRRLSRAGPRARRRLLAGGRRRRPPGRRRPGPAHAVQADVLRRLPARPGRQQRRGRPRRAQQSVPDGWIDHLWIRVHDLQASRRFYATIAPYAGIALRDDEPARVQFAGRDYSFSLIDDERPADRARPPRLPRRRRRDRARVPRGRARRRLRGQRRARGARGLPPRLLRRLRARPRRAQRRGRQSQPLSHGRSRPTDTSRARCSPCRPRSGCPRPRGDATLSSSRVRRVCGGRRRKVGRRRWRSHGCRGARRVPRRC